MTLRWLLAAVHLLGLGIGLGAIWARARALADLKDVDGVRKVFVADNWWGIAAVIWLVTGLGRWLMGLEKPAIYYSTSHVFLTKMGLFLLVVGLEILPMVTLIRWRRALAQGAVPDVATAPRLASISRSQAGLVVVMVLLATAVARAIGR